MARMSCVHKHPKTGVYYFRRAIPEDIRHAFGSKRETKNSLGTKDYAKAKRLAMEEAVQLEDQFKQARNAEPISVSEARVCAFNRTTCSRGPAFSTSAHRPPGSPIRGVSMVSIGPPPRKIESGA